MMPTLRPYPSQKKIFILAQEEFSHRVGGAITITVFHANILKEYGYDVQIVYNSGISGRPDTLREDIPSINLFEEDGTTEGYAKKLQNKIRQEKPDLLIFAFAHLYANARLRKEFRSIPKLLFFHSRPDFYFRFQPWIKRIKRRYYNTVSSVLFDSYRNLLPEFIRKEEVITLPNPIKCNLKKSDISTERKRAVFLSRIDEFKGVDLLMKAFSIAASSHPNWHLDIWGEFQDEVIKSHLEALAQELPFGGNMHFCGVTNKALETLAQYDFCIFPSYYEGFPMGLAESISCGLPCIGLAGCSGTNELILHGENGFLCDDTPEDIASKICTLMDDKELRIRMSEEAVKISDKYNEDHIRWLIINTVNRLVGNYGGQETFPLDKILELNR